MTHQKRHKRVSSKGLPFQAGQGDEKSNYGFKDEERRCVECGKLLASYEPSLEYSNDECDECQIKKYKPLKARLYSGIPQKKEKKHNEKVYVLQGFYGHGWEDLTAETDRHEILQRLKEYRENENGNYRIVRKKVK